MLYRAIKLYLAAKEFFNEPHSCRALSGLAAGFVFDWKSRQYMGPIMYCVMMLSTTDR